MLVLCFCLNLMWGAVRIPPTALWQILCGREMDAYNWSYIVWHSRFPSAVCALFSGSALAVCGLMLQTAFRNPLAGPSVFGISSGAGLGVALVLLLLGGSISTDYVTLTGYGAVLTAAFAGAAGVTGVLLLFSHRVHHMVWLLIVGIMIGYLSSSLVSLLQFFSTERALRGFLVWGMGDFSGVTLEILPLYVALCLPLILAALLFVKPLNALLLGEQYAANMGIHTERVRFLLLLLTGMLTAVVTAFCGPISFIGLAVPHMARLLLRSDDHLRLMPLTILLGGTVMLLCNVVCTLPGGGTVLPLNALTPLIGAPVIIYVILRQYSSQ